MMRAYLSQTFLFDAAHHLKRDVPLTEFAASMRVHGHTYTAEVTVAGELSDGMIVLKRPGWKKGELDLETLRKAIAEVRFQLDHRLLDENEELGRPTMENLCLFIGAKIKARHLPVSSVRVSRQTGDSARVDFA